MKCPHCGNELKEGHLICEICGEEIQIVPDFEPEIENSITETLSTLVGMEEGGEEEKEQAPDSDRTPEKEFEEVFSDNFTVTRKMWMVFGIILIFALAAAAYGFYAYRIQTVGYQVKKAQESAEQGDYETAVSYLEKAFERVEQSAAYQDAYLILFREADYYYLAGNRDAALNVLLRILDEGFYTAEEAEALYDRIITIYAADGRYEEINELLLACQDPNITNIFQSYMAKEPEFSYVEGSYAEIIPLKLSSNTSGTIYYTMDGTLPDENSRIYTAPLFLETGEYTISAFFVNDYGIKSDVVVKKYTINLSVPDAPEVELYSGEYTEPMMIAVDQEEGCSTYYTTDGSNPTTDSVPYTGPIPMPLGRTVFRFVNISKEGLSSEVTMRTYHLKLENAIPTDRAVSNLVARLVETGYLEDAAGHTAQQSGTFTYQFSSVLRVGQSADYFTVNEYYDDGTGILSRTDKVFLVEAYTGEAARLGYDENGDFIAVPI